MAILLSGNANQPLQGGGTGTVAGVPAASGVSTPSVGIQTQSPAANVPKPSNTTSTPVPTTSVKDLSGSYANVNGTIYNKTTGQAYSTPQQFFTASGVNNFNVKFDTTWKPPTATTTSAGLSMPGATTQATNTSIPSTLPALAASTQTGNPASPTVSTQSSTTQPANNGATYTPPNQGTTGVSQGGLIGNLVGLSQNQNPNYTAALNTLNNLAAQSTAIGTSGATAQNNINQEPIDLSLASGQSGLLQQLIAAKQAALAPQIQAAQTELGAANTQSGQQTSAASAATTANAPVQAGGYMSPSASNTTGQTTSGGQSLNSLLTITPNATGPGTPSAYSAGGQTFATPQDLSNWVNQQTGNPNATNASNVFQYLQQNGNNSVGNISGLNPVSQLPQLAAAVIANPAQYSQALAAGAGVPNFASALQAQIRQNDPNFDFNAAVGSGTGQQAVVAGQTQQTANATSAHQQAQAVVPQLTSLIASTGINPSDINAINKGIQYLAGNTSDPNYAQFHNLITEIATSYAAVLARNSASGGVTDQTSSIATQMLSSLSSGQTINDVLAGLDKQAQAIIPAITTTPSGQSIPSGLQMPAGFFSSP